MSAESVLTQAHELGITLTLNGDKIRYSPKTVPPEFLSELKLYKAQVIQRLQQRVCCRGCLCDNYERTQAPRCPACFGDTCANCGGCIRASLMWREPESFAVYIATPLQDLLNRLSNGVRWLTEQYEALNEDEPNANVDVFRPVAHGMGLR